MKTIDKIVILSTGEVYDIAPQPPQIVLDIDDNGVLTYNGKKYQLTEYSDTPVVPPTPEIETITVAIPIYTNSYTYNGTSIECAITNYDSIKDYITITGNKSGTNAGDYSFTVSLKPNTDTKVYKWSDDTNSAKTLNWSIAKLKVAVPNNNNVTYSGTAINIVPKNWSSISKYCTLTTVESKSEEGTFTNSVALKDTTNTQWSDSSIDTKNFSVTISLPTPNRFAFSKTYPLTMPTTQNEIESPDSNIYHNYGIVPDSLKIDCSTTTSRYKTGYIAVPMGKTIKVVGEKSSDNLTTSFKSAVTIGNYSLYEWNGDGTYQQDILVLTIS